MVTFPGANELPEQESWKNITYTYSTEQHTFSVAYTQTVCTGPQQSLKLYRNLRLHVQVGSYGHIAWRKWITSFLQFAILVCLDVGCLATIPVYKYIFSQELIKDAS